MSPKHLFHMSLNAVTEFSQKKISDYLVELSVFGQDIVIDMKC